MIFATPFIDIDESYLALICPPHHRLPRTFRPQAVSVVYNVQLLPPRLLEHGVIGQWCNIDLFSNRIQYQWLAASQTPSAPPPPPPLLISVYSRCTAESPSPQAAAKAVVEWPLPELPIRIMFGPKSGPTVGVQIISLRQASTSQYKGLIWNNRKETNVDMGKYP